MAMPVAEPMTAEEYLALPEQDLRWTEFVGGELVVDVPILRHQLICSEILFELMSWARAAPDRGLASIELAVRIGERDGRRARGFEQAVAKAAAAGLELVEPALKRAPRGYPADHPRLARLRLKSLTVFARHQLEPWLHDERCREVVRAELEGARPLVTWLATYVGSPNST